MPSEVVILHNVIGHISCGCSRYRASLESVGLAKQSSNLSLTKVTTINASSAVQFDNLYTYKLEASAIGDTILENVGLLSEGKLDLATTVDRQISIGNRRTLTVYNRRTVLFVTGELGLVLTLSYLFPWLGLEDTTVRVLQFGLCPLECFFTILLQCFDEMGVQDSRQ